MKKISLKKLIKQHESDYVVWLMVYDGAEGVAKADAFARVIKAKATAAALRCLWKIVKASKHLRSALNGESDFVKPEKEND